MCLAVPAMVLEVDQGRRRARVDYLGSQLVVGTALLDSLQPGQYVLVHVGEAIEVVDEERANDSLLLWKEWLQQP